MPIAKAKAKKSKTKLSSEELSRRAAQRAFARQVRSIFLRSGYTRIGDAADAEFTFDGRTSDFDDVFVRQNIIVCCEHTLTKESNLGDHLKNKAHIYNHTDLNRQDFIRFLRDKFSGLNDSIPSHYHDSEIRVVVVYCSSSEVKAEHRALAPSAKFLWYGSIRYFKSIGDTVRLSSRYELNEFLGLPFVEIGENGVLPTGTDTTAFSGTLLPEAHSNFPPGFKLVSFYVSPGALLQRAYVLRKDGWKDETGLYQRMIDKDKIESIRKYLRREQRTFVNNVIVTLPDTTKILNDDGNTVDSKKIDKTVPVTIQLPQISNCVGIVDGQHRVFSYYEDVNEDPQISVFRTRQNLLATGIMYPTDLSSADRSKFEAGLFLEINSTQNAARSDLKQAIAVITAPFSPDSIGKRVIARLSNAGPLEGMMERHFFDKGVLKTTSIVSYGLRPLVRLDGEASLFTLWEAINKDSVRDQNSVDALLEYIAFCATEINTFLGAAKSGVGASQWNVKKKESGGLLSVTSINSLLILFRKVAMAYGLADFSIYQKRLSNLNKIDFSTYHSSQYNRMADDMMKVCYGP